MKSLRTALCVALFLISGLQLGLAQTKGEFVVLVVAESESDSSAGALVERLRSLRIAGGLSDSEMPIRVVSADQQPQWVSRLGVTQGLPAVGVALWNRSENLGPRRFVGDAFSAPAGGDDCPRVVQSYLRLSGRPALPPFTDADTLPIPAQRGLQFESVRFEASGSPNLITNFAVRLHNESLETIRDIEVEFFVRRLDEFQWRKCGQKKVAKVASFQSVTSEFVGNTKDLFLVDLGKSAVACQYKVEATYGEDKKLMESGRFVPSEKAID